MAGMPLRGLAGSFVALRCGRVADGFSDPGLVLGSEGWPIGQGGREEQGFDGGMQRCGNALKGVLGITLVSLEAPDSGVVQLGLALLGQLSHGPSSGDSQSVDVRAGRFGTRGGSCHGAIIRLIHREPCSAQSPTGSHKARSQNNNIGMFLGNTYGHDDYSASGITAIQS